MKKILFICSGNVGRSQMAEAYYNHFTKSNKAISAGTDPTTPARYSQPSFEVIIVMKEDGIDISGNKVKTVNAEMVKNSEKIYILCKPELCPAFLLASNKITFWDVKDPYKIDVNGTRIIRDEIKRYILSIINFRKMRGAFN
jgi:arsenate reductase (thioredoxin)